MIGKCKLGAALPRSVTTSRRERSGATLRTVRPWRVPRRSELLPVSDAQSCAICGDGDWQWLYLLLNAPEWVQELDWFANWSIALCDPCHDAWDDDGALRVRWEMN